jgi:hypothetical protein
MASFKLLLSLMAINPKKLSINKENFSTIYCTLTKHTHKLFSGFSNLIPIRHNFISLDTIEKRLDYSGSSWILFVLRLEKKMIANSFRDHPIL